MGGYPAVPNQKVLGIVNPWAPGRRKFRSSSVRNGDAARSWRHSESSCGMNR